MVDCWSRWAAAQCFPWKRESSAGCGARPVVCLAALRAAVEHRQRRHRPPRPAPPARTWVFRQNFPLYDVPRHWLRMAYCTTCLDGPEDRSGIVMEWGDREGAPFVVSGQAWGED